VEGASTASEMRSVYDKLVRGRDKIADMARAQISSMKGGRVGAMLSPGRVIGAIRGMRQSKWHLELEPPADERSDVAKFYREAKATLGPAAAAELAVRQKWLSAMEEAFGPGATRATIVAALDQARRAAHEAGLGSNNTSKK